MAYLIMMAVCLLEMWWLIKPTSSIYLHCNQFVSYYLKMLVDAVFGQQNFINEIVWNYGTPSGGQVGGKNLSKVIII